MNKADTTHLIQKQKAFFATGKTHSLAFRMHALAMLKRAIEIHEKEIHAALEADLGKSPFESYMCETGMCLAEITYQMKHLKKFASPRRVKTPLAQFPAKSYVQPSPYGVTLIMSPWNYPFLLTIEPLVDALAAGNTAVVKPSAYSPYTSALIQELLEECFDPAYVAVVTGGRKENSFLLEQPFDYIFFTGSQNMGKEVLRHAAEHLTPVTLELGGKSPCIVDSTANVKLAAKRIVFGKFLNCGQTCVAPDYIYCHESKKEELVSELKKQILKQFGKHPLENPNYGKIINEKHFQRLQNLLHASQHVWGGQSDAAELRIAPAILDNVTWDDAVMQEEIFGPLLPILTYRHMRDVMKTINEKPHPLALYLFSESPKTIGAVTKHCQFGGGCVNDTIIHLATSEMGFGGVGPSGMGSYHGKTGFDTFSHFKSIVDKKTWLDLPMRYQPYQELYASMIRMFLK